MVNFQIASQTVLLFLMIYCTAAPLFQMGRRFQTGYSAPIIDQHHTMAASSSGSRKLNSVLKSAHEYDMGSLTASKLAKKGYHTSVSAHDDDLAQRHRDHMRRERSMRQARGEGDGVSMDSDSSQQIIIRKTVEQHSSLA
ncbi:hypothetical protein LTR08_007948 [Meristemomyces frigidus]|nr:hypothetical protein LTR08_007948 [Meristemomyces frigidus]